MNVEKQKIAQITNTHADEFGSSRMTENHLSDDPVDESEDTESQSHCQPTSGRRRRGTSTAGRRQGRGTGRRRAYSTRARDVDGDLHAAETVAGEVADEEVGPGLGEHHLVVAAGVHGAHAAGGVA